MRSKLLFFLFVLILPFLSSFTQEESAEDDIVKKGPGIRLPFKFTRTWVVLPITEFDPERGFGVGAKIVDVNFLESGLDARMTVEMTTEGAQDFWIETHHDGAFSRDIPVDMNFFYKTNPNRRFYGFTNRSKEREESDFKIRELLGEMRVGYRFFERIETNFGLTTRSLKVRNGEVDDVRDIGTAFSTLRGLGSSHFNIVLVNLTYDSRTPKFSPEWGGKYDITLEYTGHGMGSDADFTRFTTDWRRFIPLVNNHVLGFRTRLQYLLGRNEPFVERSALGGGDTLRGFLTGRFVDNHSALINIEDRMPLFDFPENEFISRIDGVVFFDAGRVFKRRESFTLRDYHVVGGVGLRTIFPPGVVGRLDYGISGEDTVATMAFDFPF